MYENKNTQINEPNGEHVFKIKQIAQKLLCNFYIISFLRKPY